jgi:nucleotide-binding universal stress UspA family protein
MKLDKVLIAIDFSERSIAAAQWVARSFAPQAELVLVHVLELPPPPRFLRRRYSWSAKDIETCRTGARVRLRQLARQIGRGLLWEEVREGRADEEVLRVAREYDADLIVVGSHRDRPGFWNRFGSTAERILAGASTPVLVVHGAPRNTPRSLLAAVDDSETGGKVIARAEALARRFDTTGSALHVVPRQPIHYVLMPGEVILDQMHLIDIEKTYMEETRQWLADRLTVPDGLTPAVMLGDTAESILAEARRIGADLLVLGRERKRTARRHLLGSVTSTVIRGATCPVLVIPGVDGSEPDAAFGSGRAGETNEDDLVVGGV